MVHPKSGHTRSVRRYVYEREFRVWISKVWISKCGYQVPIGMQIEGSETKRTDWKNCPLKRGTVQKIDLSRSGDLWRKQAMGQTSQLKQWCLLKFTFRGFHPKTRSLGIASWALVNPRFGYAKSVCEDKKNTRVATSFLSITFWKSLPVTANYRTLD